MNIKEIENNVNATMAHEGLTASNTGKRITRKFLKGEISSNEAIRRIKAYHLDNYKGGVNNG